MKHGPTFRRLLRDYERLCADEAIALREVNLAALARLQGQKSDVGQAIISLSAAAVPETSAAHMEGVIAAQKANLNLAQEQIARVECERQNLSSANQRLGSLGKAYKRKSNRPAALRAEG
jgi:hypothetical protein